MSAVLVVDASVALKWVVTEEGSDEASMLLSQLADEDLKLIAPEHLIGEVANGLRKRVGQGTVGVDDALAALDAIAALGVEFFGGQERWLRSLDAALEWELTTYDALYVLLALDLQAELITADRRLAHSAQMRSLPVRSLIS